jgi:hypothetical protein
LVASTAVAAAACAARCSTDSLLTLPVSAGKGKTRFPFDEGKRRMGKDKWLFLKEKRKKQWQLYIAI